MAAFSTDTGNMTLNRVASDLVFNLCLRSTIQWIKVNMYSWLANLYILVVQNNKSLKIYRT